MARLSQPLTQEQVDAFATNHGPTNWRNEITPEALLDATTTGTRVNAIVLAADIRSSTVLMREAVDPLSFATVITEFVDAIGTALRNGRGWLDKFTGDGFLAYWLYGDRDPRIYVPEVAHFANLCLSFFRTIVIEDLRINTRHFPAKAGLSLGVDGGPINLVPVAGDLTLVGAPIVGAVRMVTAASTPYETLVNGFLGTDLYNNRQLHEKSNNFTVTREIRPTKEYPSGQEVYVVEFLAPLPMTR
jgi:class 3 adenylate cyclase